MLNTAERFDPAANAWQDLPPMLRKRTDHTASVIARQLYIVGGRAPNLRSTQRIGVYQALRYSERFDAVGCTWQTLAAMSCRRTDHSASFIAGQLYVIGGKDHSHGIILSTAERFHPIAGIWQRLPDVRTTYRTFGIRHIWPIIHCWWS